MYWYFRPFKVIHKNGSFHYEVREFYKTSEGNMWTENAISPYGETKEDLIKGLELMLSDIKKRKTKTIKEGE